MKTYLIPLFLSLMVSSSLIAQNTFEINEPIQSTEILNFTLDKQGELAIIFWETLSDVDISDIDILGSKDGVHWSLLTSMPGPGKNNAIVDYASVYELHSETHFVLKQINRSGEVSYSTIKTIASNHDDSEFSEENYSAIHQPSMAPY